MRSIESFSEVKEDIYDMVTIFDYLCYLIH